MLIGPWYAQHASLASGAAQCDIVIAIYRISLSFAGNELGNYPTARKQLRWRRRLDLICTSGQRRTNTLVARTYARWPFRASGVLDPLARRVKKSRRASGQCRGPPLVASFGECVIRVVLFSRIDSTHVLGVKLNRNRLLKIGMTSALLRDRRCRMDVR